MQLILILETRSSCKSDYRYIKSTIDHFYQPRTFQIKTIYAKCKGELINKDNIIRKNINLYSGESKVIVCADYDSIDDSYNKKITKYCKNNNYDLVWMNLNVEHVYLGKIKVKDKNKESVEFLKRSDSFFKNCKNLNEENVLSVSSSTNLLLVLDKYLNRI